jgi:ParB family chromosome partitioning protein
MASTRSALEHVSGNLTESMGVRQQEAPPRLSPVPSPRDLGRRPLRNIGRLDVNQVMADPSQPREHFSEEALDRLAKSIREKGQFSPIRVRWMEQHSKWVIISGERRWRATVRAGLPTIECYFHETELKPSEILEQQLIENCLREDLRPIEEARAFQKLMDWNDWSQKELAMALRVSETRVTRILSLLRLAPELQDQTDAGKISARAAYEISKLPSSSAQKTLARRAGNGDLTCEQTAKAVRQRKGRSKPRSPATHLTFTTEDGWKIVVSAPRKGRYEEVEQALSVAMEEVRHRIRNNVQMF